MTKEDIEEYFQILYRDVPHLPTDNNKRAIKLFKYYTKHYL